MLLSEFDYTLPEELIAQKPASNRIKSKMMGSKTTTQL